MRAIVDAITTVCLWVTGIFVNQELKSELYGIAVGLVVAMRIEGIVCLIKERRFHILNKINNTMKSINDSGV